MTHSVVIEAYGGPEVLCPCITAPGKPGPGQVAILHTRIGVNFHDVYVRNGQYQTLALPGIPGIEAVGIVTETGSGNSRFKKGDRIAYVTGEYGVYTTERVIAEDKLSIVPDDITDQQAASVLLRGLTANMLTRTVGRIGPSSKVLIHGAAGGMGLLLCQWASNLGALVIGTVRTDEQAQRALRAGCNDIIYYKQDTVHERVHELTLGQGVDTVYDGVGKETFEESLRSLTMCSHLINYGQTSGGVPPVELSRLAEKSVTLTRPVIFHYLQHPKVRETMTAEVFTALREGWLSVPAPEEFPLSRAADAHRRIESQGAGTPILLVPE